MILPVRKSIYIQQSYAHIADIPDIVDPAMMSTLVSYVQALQHAHHASRTLEIG